MVAYCTAQLKCALHYIQVSFFDIHFKVVCHFKLCFWPTNEFKCNRHSSFNPIVSCQKLLKAWLLKASICSLAAQQLSICYLCFRGKTIPCLSRCIMWTHLQLNNEGSRGCCVVECTTNTTGSISTKTLWSWYILALLCYIDFKLLSAYYNYVTENNSLPIIND